MDIKTRLENEELFGYQPNIGQKRIIALNKKGIFTIEDFINCDAFNITTTSHKKKYYLALQHALKYKYKGEPLVLDVLLDKEYEISREMCGFGSHSYNRIKIDDVIKLGFEGYDISRIAKDILENKMKKNNDYYPHDISKNGGIKREFYSISIMEIIKVLAQSGDKLAQFYVDYKENVDCQEKIEFEESQKQSSSETLETLKSTIILLTAQRDELDKKINQLTEQVNTLEGGNIVNGK